MSQLTNMMEQVRKIKNGIGVQSLLDEAYKILGNPIVIFNTEYKLWAYTEAITDDPFWNEIVTHGMFSEETKRLFGNEGFIEDVTNTPSITPMVNEKFKYDRIAGKIFNKNNAFVSVLLVVACNRPFEENDPIVFEAICKLVTREISRSEFYQDYEQTHQETIIRNLIDGNYDMKIDMPQVGIIYDSLESNLYIAVVDISQCGPEHANIVHFRDLFKQIQPALKYAIYSNYIVMIISTNDDKLNVNKELSGLMIVFEQNNLYAGVSSRFENLFELQKYYREALKSMQYALECKSNQRIFPCDESARNKMEQINALENGLGIQYFLDRAPGIFGNPVLFHDMELNLLGYSKDAEIKDPIWQELITYGTSSRETIELFRTEGFIDTMDNTMGGALLVSDKIKYDRISWRIYNSGNIRIGCTSIITNDKPFSEDELVLFGIFSQKFSKEVEKLEFYDNYGQAYSETIINRLLSGKIDDYTFYSEDISNLYDHLLENIYLVAIDATRCKAELANLTYFRDLLSWPNAVNRFTIYANHIIVIISINNINLVRLEETNEYQEISKAFEQNDIYAGVSGRFDNIYELQKHYIDATSALKAGIENKKRGSKQKIFLYDGASQSNEKAPIVAKSCQADKCL